jgi:uncharacterized protein
LEKFDIEEGKMKKKHKKISPSSNITRKDFERELDLALFQISADRKMTETSSQIVGDPEEFGGSDSPDFLLEKESYPIFTPEDEAQIKELYQAHPELRSTYDPNGWIQTYTGKKFYPQRPTPESIDIIDIAHALSNQCRFTGHTREFYSVAQHCVLVSYLCKKGNALYGLLHDLSEAYIVDLPSPIKRLPELAGYRLLEKKIQRAIYDKFGLLQEEPIDVKEADLFALGIESNSLMSPFHSEWKLPVDVPCFLHTQPLAPKDAKAEFLNRFDQLFPKPAI